MIYFKNSWILCCWSRAVHGAMQYSENNTYCDHTEEFRLFI